jgi:hypothetical protein
MIANYDVIECYLTKKYVGVPNFFSFPMSDLQLNVQKLKIECDYILEIGSFKNMIIIFGWSVSEGLIFRIFNDTDLKIRYSTSFSFPNYNNSMRELYSINQLFNTDNFYKAVSRCLIYKYCKIGDESIFLWLADGRFREILFKDNKFKNETIVMEGNLNEKILNTVAFDKFKYTLGFDDNTIKVYSVKEKKLWYNLLGGSMTVIPKSFVANPNVVGFSHIILTNYAIIGCLGNLIREYSFNNNFK